MTQPRGRREGLCQPVMKLVLTLVVAGMAGAVVVLDKDPYSNLVVAVESDVEDCVTILNATLEVLSEASSALVGASDGRLAFTKVTFLVPDTITDKCGLDKSRTEMTTKLVHVALSVGMDHPVFGGQPWTLQPQGCGVPGRALYLPYSFLTNTTLTTRGKQVLHEWAKYRWGVFEEYGVAGDPVFPLAYLTNSNLTTTTSPSWTPNYCSDTQLNGTFREPCDWPDCEFEFAAEQTAESSLLALPTLSSVSFFCDNSTHQTLTPTKHNARCAGRSVAEVLEAHQDFQRPAYNVSDGGDVEVEYVRYEPGGAGSYVLLVECTWPLSDNTLKERWTMLRSAVTQWILRDVVEGSSLGIVTFRGDPDYPGNYDIRQNLTVVTTGNRRNITKSFPPTACSTDSSKFISTALRFVREQVSSESVVILVTFPRYLTSYDTADTLVQEAGNNTVWPVLYTFNSYTVPQSNINMFQTLARETGGQVLTVPNYTFTDKSKKQSLRTQLSLVQHLRHITASSLMPGAPPTQIKVSQSETDGDVATVDVFVGDNVDLTIEPTIMLYSQAPPKSLSVNNGKNSTRPILVAGTAYRLQQPFKKGHNQMTVYFDSSSPEPLHMTEVLATVREDGVTEEGVSVDFWASHDLSFLHLDDPQDPVTLYVKVSEGGRAVLGALVEVEARAADTTTTSSSVWLHLRDTGGGADVTGNDGVYSGFWSVGPQGRTTYTLAVRVTPTNSSSTVGYTPSATNSGDDGGEGLRCCGSSLNVDHLPSDQFTSTLYFLVGEAGVLSAEKPGYPPSRINDLSGAPLGTDVSLTFTAPGNHLDRGFAQKYHVYWRESVSSWSLLQDTTYAIVEGGMLAQVVFEPPACDQPLLYKIIAQNWQTQEGEESNFALVAVPCDAEPIPIPPQVVCTSQLAIVCGAYFGGVGTVLLIGMVVYLLCYRNSCGKCKERVSDNLPLFNRPNKTVPGGHTNPGMVESYMSPKSENIQERSLPTSPAPRPSQQDPPRYAQNTPHPSQPRAPVHPPPPPPGQGSHTDIKEDQPKAPQPSREAVQHNQHEDTIYENIDTHSINSSTIYDTAIG